MKTMKKIIIAFGIVLTLFLAALTVSAEEAYTRDGNKIYFGTYPQSKVTDTATTSILNELAGELPTSSNPQAWTDYNYYAEGKKQSFMWYIDIEQDGEKYRGVYFTSYRPHHLPYNADSEQDDNGYTKNTVYWFKYEPISWTIINETGLTALILCDIALDAQEYDYKGGSNHSNNYAESTIRAWLNNSFYTTAFNDLEMKHILTTNVDNSAASTLHSSNPNACQNTNDKIFLLSVAELVNGNYGFGDSTSSTVRVKQSTDYAQAQGIRKYSPGVFWWTRSPFSGVNTRAEAIYEDGRVSSTYIYYSFCGIVPALRIQTHFHSYEKVVTAPTCTEQGYTTYSCQCGDSYVANYVDTIPHVYKNDSCVACKLLAPSREIFTFKGYSIGPDGKSVCAGYEIDYDKIEIYESETNFTLEFGAVFTLYDALEGKAPLDSSTGEAVSLSGAKVMKADISNMEYLTYEFKIIDIEGEFKDYALVIAGYVYNGEKVIYCQDNGYSETVFGISYNEVCEKTLES